MSAPTQTASVPTVDALVGMSPQQRAALVGSISDPNAQAQAASNARIARLVGNRQYMRESVEHVGLCQPLVNVNGNAANWTSGTDLIFNLPTANGGFLKGILLTFAITVNPATGTGATYALNAWAPLNLIQWFRLTINGKQIHQFPLALLKYVYQTKGYQRPAYGPTGAVIAGASDSYIRNQLFSTLPITVNTNNAWNFAIYIPMNMLHADSPHGMFPMMGATSPGQLHLQTAPGSDGLDPELYPVAGAGTGHAVTITGTVKAEAIYVNGSNYGGRNSLYLDLGGEPVATYITDNVLQPIVATTTNRIKIQALLQHAQVWLTIVDGNQSNKLAADSNISGLELDQDSIGDAYWWKFGYGVNQTMLDYFFQLSQRYGQDLADEGVFPVIDAFTQGQENPSNREGSRYLNMATGGGGFTDTHVGVTLTSVGGVAGITPRLELYTISINPEGLAIAQL